MSEKELLTAAEAAERLKIAKRTLLRWARENKIESVKLSRKVVLFTAEAIDDFVKSREHKVEPAPTSHQGAGRKMARPTPTKKGGDRRTSGELWKDLRKEVMQWQ
ncbi:MAG: helix-turn-helix domain-containing protein [Desulfomonilaceae bacterium]